MTSVSGLRAPTGRAGRLWLRGRLGIAQRGVDLLDRKLRILRREQDRLALLVQRTGEDWALACRDAETWLLRAALLGGQRALRLAADGPPADITVAWRDTMGIRYPVEATCSTPEDASPPLAGTAALTGAAAAHRAALAAAVRHAAAAAAARTVDAEVSATRQRLRAIEDRWIPRLRAALAAVELALDELEHADGVRLRRAAATTRATTTGRPR
jgi:V/A-type H+/Na+-transporting ATPase subunit D